MEKFDWVGIAVSVIAARFRSSIPTKAKTARCALAAVLSRHPQPVPALIGRQERHSEFEPVGAKPSALFQAPFHFAKDNRTATGAKLPTKDFWRD